MNGLSFEDVAPVNGNIYKGEKLTGPRTVNNKQLLPYLPDEQLKEAVNLAIFLKRPLLLMGDPGCGKTRLAEAVAFELYGNDYESYFCRWDVKSTARARDGLYRYDALKRLRDAQLGKHSKAEKDKIAEGEEAENAGKVDILKEYIQEGPLGKAFRVSTPEKPAVLLIDEIDKADIDFPNDLLLEIDEGKFVIEEADNKIVTAQCPPIIFITSNNEKELPAPFLRRCLFHHIDFPSGEQLKRIVYSHFEETKDPLVEKAVEAFLAVRKTMESKMTEADKKVSTGELLDWYRVINHYYYRKIKLNKTPDIDKELEKTVQELHDNGKARIPFHQVLLKNWETHIGILAETDKK